MPRALSSAIWRAHGVSIETLALRSYHPDQASKLVRLVLEGDPNAVNDLLLDIPDGADRIDILLHLARHVDAPGGPVRRRRLGRVLMRALVSTWDHHDMCPLMRALGWSRAAFVHLCDLAGGPEVDDLPPRVRVYRGGGGDPRLVATGMSWTLDARVAEFFAERQVTIFGSSMVPRKGPRCVIAADLAREAIVLRTDGREEAEVVLRHAPRK
jgi:hypothetical protein